jgi:hypothetical protein
VPTTALAHFRQDISRARAIVNHAGLLSTGTPAEQLLRSDLLRSGWMFAVGGLDAYYCDAYTDVVAAAIISKNRHPAMVLPDFFYEIKFPIRAILEQYTNNQNWRWRMAARRMMERENVLSLDTVRSLFNRFFRDQHKFFRQILESWVMHANARRRMFGISGNRYNALSPHQRGAALDDAWERMQDRFETIIQRRHDCIHNCDRPRVSPQPLRAPDIVLNVIEDVEFLVLRSDEHINTEFRRFLLDRGCPPAVVAQAGY